MDILLLEKIAPEALEWLASRYSVEYRPDLSGRAEALGPALRGVQATVLSRKTIVTQSFLDAAPQLRAVGRMHSGSDNIDLEACRARNVRVIQSTAVAVRSNVEYVLASLLLLYRRGLGVRLLTQRQGDPSFFGRELAGSVVGILGVPPTVHMLAQVLRSLDVDLIGYDPAVHHTAALWSQLHIKPVTLPELMARADAVTVQLVYAPRYKGFVNEHILAHCRPGQMWVGLSRTSLFDESALAAALSDGRIGACMLDGAETGFAAAGSPLHGLENLILTPRIGARTREAFLRTSWYLAHRIHEALGSIGG